MSITYRLTKGSPLTWLEMDTNFSTLAGMIGNIQSEYNLLSDGTGFTDLVSTTLSFNSSTRVLTLAAASGYTPNIYQFGTAYPITSTSIVISNVSMGRYIRYNTTNLVLEEVLTGYPNFLTDVLVAYIYWDAGAQKLVIFGDERHAVHIDSQWHKTHHIETGAVWRTGGNLGFTLNSSTTVRVTVATPLVIADEDLEWTINDGPSNTVPWQQAIASVGNIPTLWVNSTGNYSQSEVVTTSCPWLYNGSGAQYNPLNGSGQGSLVNVPDGQYFNYWLIATNDLQEPVKFVVGRNVYPDSSTVDSEVFNGLGLPMPEVVPMYKIVLQRSVTNTGNPALVSIIKAQVLTGRQVATTAAFNATSHTALSDRSLNDQHPIGAISGLQALLALLAPLASPALTGTPTTSTAAAKVATTQIASTAFVDRLRSLFAGITTGTPSTTDRGCVLAFTGAVTLPPNVFNQFDVFTIYNSSGSSFAVSPGSGVTMTLAGTTNPGARTLAPNGLMTVLWLSGTSCVVAGAGVT